MLISVEDPVFANVGSAIVEKDVGFPRLEFLLDELATFVRFDIFGERDASSHLFDGYQIHADDQTKHEEGWKRRRSCRTKRLV